jgi:hypothetical protein
MGKHVTVLLSHDAGVGPAAHVLAEQLKVDFNDCGLELSIRLLPVSTDPCAHREAVYTALQQLYHIKHEDLHIVALFGGPNPDEYRRIHDFCASTKPAIGHVQVVTSLSHFSDAGLAMRNLARKVTAAAATP